MLYTKIAVLNGEYLEAFPLKSGMEETKVSYPEISNWMVVQNLNRPLEVMIECSKVAKYKINIQNQNDKLF